MTRAMKMVASSKLRGAQESLKASRAFKDTMENTWELETLPPNPTIKNVATTFCADRGLAGGLLNVLLRVSKPIIKANHNSNSKYIVVGQKGAGTFGREYRDGFDVVFNDLFRQKRYSFKQATCIAQEILKNYPEAQRYDFYSQLFVNTSVNVPTHFTYPDLETLMSKSDFSTRFHGTAPLPAYKNFWELKLAAIIFNLSCESFAAESAARMNAMSNATTSAEDMISRLSLLYNRTRQSKITGELIEIISGAASILESEEN